MAEATRMPTWRAEQVPTGVPNLDRLIDGGLERGALVLIVGGPGTGKTVLAEQMAFHWAQERRKVLWVVTPGEPNEKFLTHVSQMGFYDARLVGDGIQIINLSRYLEQGRKAQMDVIRETVQAGDYAYVVVDGFQSMRCFLGGERDVRLFLSELSSELALLGITMIVTLDANPERYWEAAEFTMADIILLLGYSAVDGRERRQIQILKQRGHNHAGGAHSYDISRLGIHVHPRVEALLPATDGTLTDIRHGFGLPGLDQMLGGGLLEGSTTLIAGGAGTGKTLLASQFLAEGLRLGQPGLYLGFFEDHSRLLQRAEAFGMPLRQGHESGLLQMKAYSYGRCDPDACLEEVVALADAHEVRRLVLDGLEPIERELEPSGRVTDVVATIVGYLGRRGITAVFTYELPEVLAPTISLRRPLISQVVGNLIFLRFSGIGTRRRRLLSVLKTRYVEHSDAIAELMVAGGRLEAITDPAAVEPEAPDLVPIAFRDEPQGGHYH